MSAATIKKRLDRSDDYRPLTDGAESLKGYARPALRWTRRTFVGRCWNCDEIKDVERVDALTLCADCIEEMA